jgi:hypothetical protein
MPVIPALGKQRQEDSDLEASMGYPVRPCLKSKNKKKTFVVKECVIKMKRKAVGVEKLRNLFFNSIKGVMSTGNEVIRHTGSPLRDCFSHLSSRRMSKSLVSVEE